jgi:hypothetical protein
MRGPQVRADKEHDSHALIARHERNPNFKGKSIAQAECAHCKQLGHKQETCWFFHPELRPVGWIKRATKKERGRKTCEKEKKGETLSKREELRIFSTKMILDPMKTKIRNW